MQNNQGAKKTKKKRTHYKERGIQKENKNYTDRGTEKGRKKEREK